MSNNISFTIHDQCLIAKQYCKTLEEAKKNVNTIDLSCEIFPEETNDYSYFIIWTGENAMEVAKSYLTNNPNEISKYRWIFRQEPENNTFLYKKLSNDAVPPSKSHIGDSGYDLTILRLKKIENGTYFFHTDIAVQPPCGYYFEMYPRSSLSKTGFIMANSVGIIDQYYRGEIIVALKKIDPNCNDLTLPMKVTQLIPKQFIHLESKETEFLDSSIRSYGGFGSTS